MRTALDPTSQKKVAMGAVEREDGRAEVSFGV